MLSVAAVDTISRSRAGIAESADAPELASLSGDATVHWRMLAEGSTEPGDLLLSGCVGPASRVFAVRQVWWQCSQQMGLLPSGRRSAGDEVARRRVQLVTAEFPPMSGKLLTSPGTRPRRRRSSKVTGIASVTSLRWLKLTRLSQDCLPIMTASPHPPGVEQRKHLVPFSR